MSRLLRKYEWYVLIPLTYSTRVTWNVVLVDVQVAATDTCAGDLENGVSLHPNMHDRIIVKRRA